MTDIILADNHEPFVKGVEKLLKNSGDYRVLAKAINGTELTDALNKHQPDLILLDINMLYLSGNDTVGLLKKKHTKAKVAFITMYDDHEITAYCKTHKLSGYLLPHVKTSELGGSLELIMKGSWPYTTLSL